jgi:vacuolar protein sorting-associated protein 13A/C
MIIDLRGIGLSFLDEVPKEIFFISFYGMKLIYRNTMLLKNNENIEHINFYLKNFQIDYCLNDSLKSLIYPKIQKIPSLEEQNVQDGIDFIMIFIERTSYFNSEKKIQYMNYNKIAFCFQEMNVKINQIILFHLISLIQGYTSLLDYAQKIKKNNDIYVKEENLIENNDKYIETLKKENLDKNKTLINFLILSSLKINITLRIDLSNIEISFLPDILSNTIMSLGSSLIRISESPLSFSPKVIKDIYMDTNMIISILIKEFTTEGILQIYKILGSTDLIGNPVNLIDKIGNGFFELVNEPTKGLMQGPTQFTKGLAKGVTGLLNGVVGGSMDSVSKITGTLYTTVHGILGKKEAQLMDEDDEPENLLVGVAQGITGGYKELKEGLTGFFVNPFQNAQKEGAVGFIQGLSTGIFGLAISPFAFALKLGGSLAVGTKNTFSILYNKSQKNQRFRFPRYIEESKPLQIYDSDLSAANEFLSKLTEVENPIILYFSSFICNNDGYDNKLAFLIVTNQIILILSNENKILLNIKITDLKDVKLYYINDNFNLVLVPKSKKHKDEKRIIIDKSCAIMACHFYDILKEEISLLSL